MPANHTGHRIRELILICFQYTLSELKSQDFLGPMNYRLLKDVYILAYHNFIDMTSYFF